VTVSGKCSWYLRQCLIIILAPLEGAHLLEGTCTLGEHCKKVTIIISHSFIDRSWDLINPYQFFGRSFDQLFTVSDSGPNQPGLSLGRVVCLLIPLRNFVVVCFVVCFSWP
jgi:hypothetical protein